MTDPIEVIARAFCQDSGEDPDAINMDGDLNEPHLTRSWPLWHEHQRHAETAIAALNAAGLVVVPKEPTKKMIKAALKYKDDGAPAWAHKIYGGTTISTPEGIYKAMIEEAGK